MTPIQVFCCQYCEVFKNSFFYRTPPVAGFIPKNSIIHNHPKYVLSHFKVIWKILNHFFITLGLEKSELLRLIISRYGNHSYDLQRKWLDLFLYDGNNRPKLVKGFVFCFIIFDRKLNLWKKAKRGRVWFKKALTEAWRSYRSLSDTNPAFHLTMLYNLTYITLIFI